MEQGIEAGEEPDRAGRPCYHSHVASRKHPLDAPALAVARSSQRNQKAMNPLLQRISIDPGICDGKPCMKGTRIWCLLIFDFLAERMIGATLLV